MSTITLAMFPLELVVFPTEKLALHIFEDRYVQLIKDCEYEDMTFGIPTYVNKRLEFGTEVRLEKVVKRYPSGAMDIICRGIRIFRIHDFFSVLEPKLYAGGSITILNQISEPPSDLKKMFIKLLREFYNILGIETPEIDDIKVNSYNLSHKIGLTLEQEYDFLQILSENERYKYLIEHLQVLVPAVKTINRTKELIHLNGHFKNFDPLDFTEYGK